MSLKIEFDQHIVSPSHRLRSLERQKLIRVVASALGAKALGEISIAFVTPTAIRRLNRAYRHKDKVTDVLSFRLDPELGEVLVCYTQAKKQAVEHKWPVKIELTDIIIHGILHTFGFDHQNPKDAKLMLTLQAKILKAVC
ncbi:MAG: rRNA maturation RNase YbeY [Patescibacteria group bacterium]